MKIKPAALIFILLMLIGSGLWAFRSEWGGKISKPLSHQLSPAPSTVAPRDGFRQLVEKKQPGFKLFPETENWRVFRITFANFLVLFKFPPGLISKEETKTEESLLKFINFFPPGLEGESLPIFQVKVFNKSISSFLSEEGVSKAEDVEVGDIKAKKIRGVDTKGHKVEIIYLPLDRLTLVLQGTVFNPDEVGVDCRRMIDSIIESFKVEKR